MTTRFNDPKNDPKALLRLVAATPKAQRKDALESLLEGYEGRNKDDVRMWGHEMIVTLMGKPHRV